MTLGVIKAIGIAATIVGAGATIVSSWVSGKQQDAKIAEEVAKAMAKTSGKEP